MATIPTVEQLQQELDALKRALRPRFGSKALIVAVTDLAGLKYQQGKTIEKLAAAHALLDTLAAAQDKGNGHVPIDIAAQVEQLKGSA